MYNFPNETDPVRNAALRYFLVGGHDFFKDCELSELLRTGPDLVVTVVCKEDAHPAMADWRAKLGAYELYFRSCIYVESEGLRLPDIFLNARLKDSPRLATVRARSEEERELTGLTPGPDEEWHHVRIQVLPAAYIDVIFLDFQVGSEGCTLEAPTNDFSLETPDTFGTMRPSNCAEKTREELHRIALMKESFDRPVSIAYLAWIGDERAEELAVLGLRDGYDDVLEELWTSSVWALGRIGGPAALEELSRTLQKADRPIMRRHVRDAIERVVFRLGGEQSA